MVECPVCQYSGLTSPPYELWPPPENQAIRPPYEEFLGRPSYEVCPSCGFEFGFDDNPGTTEGESFAAYRDEWVKRGRPWFDRGTAPADQ